MTPLSPHLPRARSARSPGIVPLGLTLSLLAACGGGGGGGGGTPTSGPALIAVTFVGIGATPAAGDRLLLVFDAAVEPVPGASFDDDDVSLAGGSLGTVTAAPASTRPLTIEITLGAGVSFTPGTSTFALGADLDALRATADGARPATATTPLVIRRGDGDFPTIDTLTVESIDGELNGTGPAGGSLQIARTGVRFDVAFQDATQAAPPAAVVLSVDGDTLVDGAIVRAGRDLAGALGATTLGTGTASVRVRDGAALPIGARVATVVVIDASGMPSLPATFAFRAVQADAALRPLESGQVWYLSIDRDLESFEVRTRPPFNQPFVAIVAGANGVPDLLDVFTVLGMRTTPGIADIGDGRSSNTAVLDAFERAVLAKLAQLYEDVDVTFTFDAPGTFPSGASFAYASFGFSQICLAGAPNETGSGTLGIALVDLRNAFQDDDCDEDFAGLRLGVFLHTVANLGLETSNTAFRLAFRDVAPALGGTAIGGDPLDGERLLGTRQDSRAASIDAAITYLATVAAVVTAHECGHSMGLVANGAMPRGLYGDDPVNFPLSGNQPASNANAHIENQSLFPGSGQNIMSPAVDLDAAQSPDTKFNSLNRAYLREKALYDER
ncbi:MAG: hypothetical protein IPM29_09935 [Planctomycetes bacterium]|nr:hypothetical protein [Planctomycetota bacterium]